MCCPVLSTGKHYKNQVFRHILLFKRSRYDLDLLLLVKVMGTNGRA
jgi:hypothetical protein